MRLNCSDAEFFLYMVSLNT